MAVPRLRKERCFIELKPHRLKGLEKMASTIKGAFKYGKAVLPQEMKPVDLIIAGVVAVNLEGAKVGKAGGYSDLEFAIAREFKLVSDATPIITTVHPIQVIEEEIPMQRHDISIDYIITPTQIIKTKRRYTKPKGIYWDILPQEKIESIPILQKLKPF
jgi:5-formyltetrahydrofolate cyclo-ligase